MPRHARQASRDEIVQARAPSPSFPLRGVKGHATICTRGGREPGNRGYSICTCIHVHVCVFSCSIFLSSLYIYNYTCTQKHECKHSVHQNRKIQVLMYTCTLECVSVTTMYTLQETNMIHTAVLEMVILGILYQCTDRVSWVTSPT